MAETSVDFNIDRLVEEVYVSQELVKNAEREVQVQRLLAVSLEELCESIARVQASHKKLMLDAPQLFQRIEDFEAYLRDWKQSMIE